MNSIIPRLQKLQELNGRSVRFPRPDDKIGFAFNTKDRVEFSLKTLESIDVEGVDVVWCDGSTTEEGKELAKNYKFSRARCVERNLGIGGGPDKAIQFGLNRLLELRYDYCGLIENDIVFKRGWLEKLMNSLSYAASDGLVVGAGTVRTYEKRVMETRGSYAITWNIGAGIILFSCEAAELILRNYTQLFTTGRKLQLFFANALGIDLGAVWPEICHSSVDCRLSADFSYDRLLYSYGFATIGTMPSFVIDLDPQSRVKPHIEQTKELDTELLAVSLFRRMNIQILVYILEPVWVVLRRAPFLMRRLSHRNKKI